MLVSLLSALCRRCLGVTVHVGLQQPPLSKEQAPKLPAKAQAMFCHNFCQRFAFHLFGVQQQEQGRKLSLPLEKLTLDPKQHAGQGGTHPPLHCSAFRSCASAHSGYPRASWLNSVYPDCTDQQSLGMDQASATHHLPDRRASWLIPAQPGSLYTAHMMAQLMQHCCHQLCPLRSTILDGTSSLYPTRPPTKPPTATALDLFTMRLPVLDTQQRISG